MKVTYKNFIISESFIGGKSSSWDLNNTNYHKVTIKNTENGKKTSFDFWCSIVQPEFKTEYDLLNAFYCFLSDAEAGYYELDDFYKDFSYENITDCIKAWKGCKKALAKCKRLFDNDDEIFYKTINELSEIAG